MDFIKETDVIECHKNEEKKELLKKREDYATDIRRRMRNETLNKIRKIEDFSNTSVHLVNLKEESKET